MFSIPHLIIVFVVALVVFGPEKLPELARNVGKLMGEFRKATGDLRSTFEGHLRDLEREADLRRPTNSLTANTIGPIAPASAAAPYSAYTASPAAAEAEVSTALGAAGTVPTTPPHLSIGTPVADAPLPAPVTPAEPAPTDAAASNHAEATQHSPELHSAHDPESLTDAGIHSA